MKKTVIGIVMVLLTCTSGYGRDGGAPGKVQKQEFEQMVTHLRDATEQGNEQDAKKTWEQIHRQMLAEFAEVKIKMTDAIDRNDKSEENRYMEIYKSQLDAYTAACKHRFNLIPYNAELFERLAQYVNTLL